MGSHGEITFHSDVHQFWNWKQATDPNTTDPGEVDDLDIWVDSTSSPFVLKIWNAAGPAWVTIGGSGAAYTDEQAQDAINTMLIDTTSVDFTYTDGTPELKFDVKDEYVQDLMDSSIDDTSSIVQSYNDGTGKLTFNVVDEYVRDTIHSTVIGGKGLTATVSDAGDTVTLDVDDETRTISFVIDGGGSAITTGVKGDIYFDTACTVTQWHIAGEPSGSIVVELWSDVHANYPPTSGDALTTTEKPTLSSATFNSDTSLNSGAGWAIAAGSWLRYNVLSASTLTRVTVALRILIVRT